MSDDLTAREVRSIVDLARLAPSPDEEEVLLGRLRGILAYVRKLEELDTTEIPPSASVVSPTEHGRVDEPRDSLPPETVLERAPGRQGDFFLVPRVIE